MALIQCKECKKEVSNLAKKCPHCGISKPGMTAKKAGKGCLLLILLILICGWLAGRGDKTSSTTSEPVKQSLDIKNGDVRNFEAIAAEDYSIAGRSRIKIYVLSPEAKTFEERAATIQQAAKQYLQQEKVNEVTALLEVSKGMATHGVVLASAVYTPDGCGNDIGNDTCTGKIWSVQSSSDVITPKQISISDAWFANRAKFIKKDGLLNEAGLKKMLSNKLNIPLEEITVPFISLKPVTE